MKTADTFAKLINTVVEIPGLRQVDLARRLHIEPSSVSRLIKSGQKSNLIAKNGKGYYPGELFLKQWRQN